MGCSNHRIRCVSIKKLKQKPVGKPTGFFFIWLTIYMNLSKKKQNNKNIRSIVIGGGFGGIAIALRLRSLGHQVTLIERLGSLGGRAQVFKKNGFKHDAGPTVITAPFLFDELFELFNEKREEYIEFKPLEPWYRFHFHDGQTFDYSESIQKTKKEMKKFSIEDANNYDKLLEASKAIFDVGFTKLSDKPFSSFFI